MADEYDTEGGMLAPVVLEEGDALVVDEMTDECDTEGGKLADVVEELLDVMDTLVEVLIKDCVDVFKEVGDALVACCVLVVEEAVVVCRAEEADLKPVAIGIRFLQREK